MIHWEYMLWFWECDLWRREKNKPHSGHKQNLRIWCEDISIEAGSSVASDSLSVVRIHWGRSTSPTLTIGWVYRVESQTTAVATWLPTSLSRTAKGTRLYWAGRETITSQLPQTALGGPTAMCDHHLSPFPTSRVLKSKQPSTLALGIF